MIKKNITISIICFTLIGCHQESGYKSRYTLKLANDSINIKIGNNSRNLSFCIQYFNSNDSNYLAVRNEKFNSIEIYNIDSKRLLKVIGINFEGRNAFGGIACFLMNNLDTIIVINMMPKLVGIFDSDGKILKKMPFENDIEGRVSHTTVPTGGQRPFFNHNTIFLAQQYGAAQSSGILTSIEQKHTNINFSLDIQTGVCRTSPLTYPEELINKDISGNWVTRVLGFKEHFIYHFGSINGLYITKDFLSFTKVPLETNYKLKLYENNWKNMSNIIAGLPDRLEHDQVYNLYYDTYRECYYLIVRQRSTDPVKNTNDLAKFIYPHCFITILDKNLNHMGDVFFPENIYSFQMMFITAKGLYISEDHINNPTYSEDYMRFRLLTLEKL